MYVSLNSNPNNEEEWNENKKMPVIEVKQESNFEPKNKKSILSNIMNVLVPETNFLSNKKQNVDDEAEMKERLRKSAYYIYVLEQYKHTNPNSIGEIIKNNRFAKLNNKAAPSPQEEDMPVVLVNREQFSKNNFNEIADEMKTEHSEKLPIIVVNTPLYGKENNKNALIEENKQRDDILVLQNNIKKGTQKKTSPKLANTKYTQKIIDVGEEQYQNTPPNLDVVEYKQQGDIPVIQKGGNKVKHSTFFANAGYVDKNWEKKKEDMYLLRKKEEESKFYNELIYGLDLIDRFKNKNSQSNNIPALSINTVLKDKYLQIYNEIMYRPYFHTDPETINKVMVNRKQTAEHIIFLLYNKQYDRSQKLVKMLEKMEDIYNSGIRIYGRDQWNINNDISNLNEKIQEVKKITLEEIIIPEDIKTTDDPKKEDLKNPEQNNNSTGLQNFFISFVDFWTVIKEFLQSIPIIFLESLGFDSSDSQDKANGKEDENKNSGNSGSANESGNSGQFKKNIFRIFVDSLKDFFIYLMTSIGYGIKETIKLPFVLAESIFTMAYNKLKELIYEILTNKYFLIFVIVVTFLYFKPIKFNVHF